MHHSEMFYDVLIFLAASVVVVSLFKRVRTSAILGYLTSGMILGPAGLAFINQSESLNMLAEFGVVFLLFMIGLEFSVSKLRSLAKLVFGLGALQVVITATIISLITVGFMFDPGAAVIIGGGLALSSTAFVLQLLSEQGERDTQHGKVALAILLFQDLAIVPLLILLTVLADAQASFVTALGIAVGEAAISLGIVYVAGRVLFRPLYKIIAQSDETDLFIVTTLLLIFGVGWFLSLFGVSMALGGFLAGLLLSETEFRHQIEADIKPFKGMLLGLFFMTVGMTIDIKLLINEFATILMLVAGLLVLKTVLIAGLAKLFGAKSWVALRVGFLLAQGGEFGFVLFISGSSLGLIAPEVVQILLTCIAITMAVTPFLAKLGASLALKVRKAQPMDGVDAKEVDEQVCEHAIIVGFGRVGQTIAMLLNDKNLPVVALDMDIERIQALKEGPTSVFYGDAKQVTVLRSMGIERARCVIITIDETLAANQIIHAVHQVAPNLKVYVRARDVAHVRLLQERKDVRAVPEAVEGSLQLGSIVLRDFGVSRDDANAVIRSHRDYLYHDMLEVKE